MKTTNNSIPVTVVIRPPHPLMLVRMSCGEILCEAQPRLLRKQYLPGLFSLANICPAIKQVHVCKTDVEGRRSGWIVSS